MKLGFCSDWHLNFLSAVQIVDFIKYLNDQDVDAFVVTGDLSEGISIEKHLYIINNMIDKPLYYVHGNHDFYYDSFHNVRRNAVDLNFRLDNIHWLEMGEKKLTDKAVIYGCDGFYDGGFGDPYSRFELLDFNVIGELKRKDNVDIFITVKGFAKLCADSILQKLPKLFIDNDLVVFATHVPPFKELCKYRGNPTEDYALPFFASKIVGEALMEVMSNHKNKKLILLCGHTHDEAYFDIDNISGICAPARYKHPSLYKVIEI